MKHHLIKELEVKQCLYCNCALKVREWNSEWAAGHYYKSIKCGCGRINRTSVDFHGSGHDGWKEKSEWFFKQNQGGFEMKVDEEHKKIKG